MLNSLLYATSFTIFRGEMGGGGRTVERFWRFREIKRTLNGREKYIKQLLATTSAKKWSKCFINRKEEKGRWLAHVLMTFKHCQTLQGFAQLWAYNNFSLRSLWFFRARAQLRRASLRYPSPTKPPVTQTNATLTLFRIAYRANTV